MKKISWKSALVGRLVGAACAMFLILFTMSATVANAALLTFDTLGDDTTVPSGYGGLMWNNFYSLDGVNYDGNPSGYEAGVVSPNNVAFNGFGSPASITIKSGFFKLNSAYLTGAWNDNLVVTVKGYIISTRGVRILIYSHSYRLSATHPTLIKFTPVIVQEVDFISSGGTPHEGYTGSGEHFAIDNLNVTLQR